MENDNYIKQKVDDLFEKLVKSAASFIYKPDEIKRIKEDIYKLQNKCEHKYENGKCIYCRKEE